MRPGEFCWNELATTDIEKSKDFYGKLFGWEFEEIKTDDMSYAVIKSGNEKGFAGIWQIPTDKQKEIPPHWMAYVLVKDIKASLKKAEDCGAKIVKEITHVSDIGFFAIIIDPTNAHIALWEAVEKK